MMTEQKKDFSSSFSVIEQRMLELNYLNPSADILSRALTFKGNFNISLFKEAVRKVVNNYRILTCRYSTFEEKRVFHEVDLDYMDMSEANNDRILNFIQQYISSPMQLSDDHLLCLNLFKCKNSEYIFLTKLQHIVADGVSLSLVFEEILRGYFHLLKGDKLKVALPNVEFSDYRSFESAYLTTEDGFKDKLFWEQKLASQNVPVVPDMTATVSLSCDMFSQELSEDELLVVYKIIEDMDVTLVSYLTAAYQQTLSEWLDHRYCLSFSMSLRRREEHRYIVGPMFRYANLAVRENECWGDKIIRLSTEIKEALDTIYASDTIGPHGSIGNYLPPQYCYLINYLNLKRNRGAFDTGLIGNASSWIRLADDLKIKTIRLQTRLTPYGMYLSIGNFGDRLSVDFIYNRSCFSREQVKNFSLRWKNRLLYGDSCDDIPVSVK
ncbi:condensation domain-containing protein [Shewanella surugensis]|uniref:Condensation domain-containing protein n=1 Tax=Shewanella surugensis TaxID=212020 RepID=A0ABT0L8Y8_9GAMM|nr:condensation domain-containing protein [Shewanella surugensis]MCL1123835.1 condensation domain-containing protein [Shewanella surugensis]